MTIFRFFTFLILIVSSPVLASTALSERAIAERGLIACLTEFCTTFQVGQVLTQKTIDRIEDKDVRKAKARQSAKARVALSALGVLAETLQASELSTSDRCEVFRQLACIHDKVTNHHEVGVGNIELGAVISILMSGLYFQIYEDIDAATQRSLLALFSSRSKPLSGQVLRSAFASEGMPTTKLVSSLDDSLVGLAFQMGLSNVTNKSKVAVLDTMAKELHGKSATAPVACLLDELDEQWLAWDILWAERLRVLCIMSQHLPTEQATTQKVAALQFRAFETAISTLSDVERASINTRLVSSRSNIKRMANIILEIQERLENRGHHVLAMLSFRLRQTE